MSHIATLTEARAAKSQALELFGRIAEVVGVGITRVGDSYAVKVNLRQAPGSEVTLPDHVAGVPVRVEVVGPIRTR